MPIVPNLAMPGSPASPNAPAMERGGSVRVNAGEALAGLGRIADNLAGMAPVPGVPQNLGQGAAQGMVNLGQGVKDLGQARMDIEARRAEARNYVELSKASLEMDREISEFQKFQETNPDPATWLPEWERRSSEWPGRYLEGRDYPPALQDSIRARVLSRGQQFGMDVDVAATRQTVALARESLMAEVSIAEEGGRLDEASALLRTGVEKGWVRADVATERELQAQDNIERRTVADALDYADAFAMRGDMENAFGALDSIRGIIPEGEYQAKRARMETQVSVTVAKGKILDRLSSGEDPDDIRAELEARNEDGSYVAHSELRPAVRAEILAPLYAASNAEYESLVGGAAKLIDSGVIKDENELNSYFERKEIDPLNKAILTAKLRGEVVKTEKAIVDLQAAAASYDPSKDPDGRAYSAQMSATLLTLGDDPRSEEILGTLTKRRNGEPLTLSEDIFRVKAREVSDLRDSAADYKVSASNLVIEEKDGRQVFVDYSEAPEAGDPARFEKTVDPWFGKPTVKAGRVVEVSQQDRETLLKAFTPDRNAFDAEKAAGIFVTDLKKKAAADSETASVLNEMKRRADTGVVKEDNWEEQYKGVVMPIKDKATASMIDGALTSPGTPEQRRIEALRNKRDMLRAAQGN